MQMKIQKLLTMSESGLVRVVDFNDDEKKNFLNEDKFRKGKSRQGSPRHEADVYVIYCDDFDEMESQIKEYSSQMESLQNKIQSLQNDIQEKKKRIESLQDELSSIYSDHQKELEDKDEEYSGKIAQLKEDLHEKDLEIERTKRKYEEEIGQIKEANRDHLEGLKIFDEEKHILIKDHNDEVSKLKESQFNPESDMKISDHNRQVNGIKNRIVETVIPHNDNINRLDSIGLLALLKGELKEVRKDLKKDIQAFEDIAHYIESKNENIIVEVKKEKEEDDDSSS